RRLALGLLPVLIASAACRSAQDDAEGSDVDLTASSWQALWQNVSRTGRMFDGAWTNWYRHGRAVSIVKLGILRKRLEENQLHPAYPKGPTGTGSYVCGDARTGSTGEDTVLARTYDGSCNVPNDPGAGAAGTRFGRNISHASINAYVDGEL